jgi:putative transposase
MRCTTAFAREVDDQIWLVSFLDYDLGYFDHERGRVLPGPNPFMPDNVSTLCPEQGVTHQTRSHSN